MGRGLRQRRQDGNRWLRWRPVTAQYQWARRPGRRFGGGLEPPERVAHGLPQLAVPVGRDVDDPGRGRDPADLVGLGDLGAACHGLDAVAPYSGLAAAFLGDEGELPARVGCQDAAVPGPAHEAETARPRVHAGDRVCTVPDRPVLRAP